MNYELKFNKAKYPQSNELLRSRLFLLTGKDRVLMTLFLEDGHNFSQLSQLTGHSESTIARKIHTLTERLLNCEYITCIQNRSRFTKEELSIAKHYFLLGFSMKKISFKTQRSYYRIRKTIKKINRILNTLPSRTKINPKQWQPTPSQKVLIGN